MKQIYYLQMVLSLLLLGVGSASAQEAVNVSKTDGGVVSTKLEEMKEIVFSADETTMTILAVNGTSTDIALTDITSITFGEYLSIPSGITTPQDTKFIILKDGALHISCPDGIKNVYVYDATGKVLHSNKKVDARDLYLPLSTLRKGVCIIRVQTGTAVVSKKIIIK